MPNLAIVKPQPGDEITSVWGTSVADGMNGIQGGSATVTFSGSTASGAVAVTFPRAFASPPVVVACIGALGNYWGLVGSITATGCSLQARSPVSIASGSVSVYYIAIGVPA